MDSDQGHPEPSVFSTDTLSSSEDSLTDLVVETNSSSEEKVESPIDSVERVFNDFIRFQESTDSEDNKALMTAALNQLDSTLTMDELTLIINVWMYYDPTDFSTRTLTERVLFQNRIKSIEAVKMRKANPREWEDGATAPYSELDGLLEKLEKG